MANNGIWYSSVYETLYNLVLLQSDVISLFHLCLWAARTDVASEAPSSQNTRTTRSDAAELIGNGVAYINKATRRRTRLVLRWINGGEYVTSPRYPQRDGN